jgi:multidrug efflux pump subunit AcrA (membrane-fusion protein)
MLKQFLNKVPIYMVSLVVLVGCGALFGDNEEPEVPVVRGYILDIEEDTAVVKQKPLSISMTLIGSVEGITKELHFETTSSRVPFDRLLVHEGQRVKAGDALAVLDIEALDERIADNAETNKRND